MNLFVEQFLPVGPVLLVLLGGILSVVVEAFVPRANRGVAQLAVSGLVLLAALGWSLVSLLGDVRGVVALGSITVDGPALALWSLLLLFGLGSLFLFAERRLGNGQSAFAPAAYAVPGSQAEREAIANRLEHTEVFALLMFSISGMMIFVSASDFLTMFVGLEVFSLPLYVLTGLSRRRRLLSQEAAMKYFLLGSLSSAIFLYGMALVYGFAGAFDFILVDQAVLTGAQSQWLLMAGMALVIVGVAFKLGAVPFHNWMPDVYQGAPTAVTGFMAVCTKIAAVGGMLRVLYVAFGSARWDWQLLIAVLAVLTMVVGAVVGLGQTDVKRLLVYSAIVHAGFLLVGIVGAETIENGLGEGQVGSVSASIFYLAAYGFATLGAFAIVTMVRRAGGEATSFDAWSGLGKRNPLLAVLMTIFLLSMAGIPLTGGFIAKVLVFMAGWQGGYAWLVVIAVIASLITAGFYFRLVMIMFGKPSVADDVVVVTPSVGTQIVVWVGIIGTLLLGIFPGPLMELFNSAAVFLR